MPNYPDLEGFAYSFARAELTVARRKITAITNVSFSQPTTEAGVMGTRPWPIARTEGSMEMGDGTITFSDEAERIAFIDRLGEVYRNVIWQLDWLLSARNRPLVRLACLSCRVLDNPFEHENGEEALGGDVQFSFLRHTINGKSPHGT